MELAPLLRTLEFLLKKAETVFQMLKAPLLLCHLGSSQAQNPPPAPSRSSSGQGSIANEDIKPRHCSPGPHLPVVQAGRLGSPSGCTKFY